MSAHGHGAHEPHASHADHSDHAEHGHDEDEFPADEPHSPAWLPLLGGALFLSALLLWVAFAPPAAAQPAPAGNAAAAAPVPAPPNPAARPPAPAPVPAPRPALPAPPAGGAH